MREHPTPEAGDWEKAPFSNGTEGELWTHNVCGAGDGCIRDEVFGAGPAGADCPLITLSFMGVWPHEWERVEVHFTTTAGEPSTYHRPGDCAEFTDLEPGPPPVVTVDLFGEYRPEPEEGTS